MLCPFCQTAVSAFAPGPEGKGLRCPLPECVGRDNDVPALYTRDYAAHPAVPLSVFGPGGHGKTVFLEAFVTTLERRVRWPRFSAQFMDEAGMAAVRMRLRALRESGALPDTTQAVFPTPRILRLRNVPVVGGCQLLMYDTSGETFRDSEYLIDAGRYVRNSPVVTWLVSLTELDYPEQLSDLMTTYADGMAKMGADCRDQALVLTLTKGDLLLARPDFPKSAREFLADDDLDPAAGAWGKLAAVSEALSDWLATTEHRNVVNILRDQFREVRFCVVSAQGAAARDQVLQMELMPRGVLAPLFWVWRLSSPGVSVETGGGRTEHWGLAAALSGAPAGATIRLEPGVHRLSESVLCRNPVAIRGRSAALVRIESTAAKYAVVVKTEGLVAFKGVTLAHSGGEPADVVRVFGGRLALEDCVVTGGVGGPGAGGDGLVVADGAAVLLRTQLVANARHGASGIGGEVSAGDCAAERNGGAGFSLSGKSARLADCRAVGNGQHGLRLAGACAAEAPGFNATGNKREGVSVAGTAQLAAPRLASSANQSHGVAALDQARVTLDSAQITGNREAGLYADGNSALVVRGGSVTGSERAGAVAVGSARLELVGVEVRGNKGAGVVCGGDSGGTLDRVTASGNGLEGLRITGNARFELGPCDLADNKKGPRHVAPTAVVTALAPVAPAADGSAAGASGAAPRAGKRGWFS